MKLKTYLIKGLTNNYFFFSAFSTLVVSLSTLFSFSTFSSFLIFTIGFSCVNFVGSSFTFSTLFVSDDKTLLFFVLSLMMGFTLITARYTRKIHQLNQRVSGIIIILSSILLFIINYKDIKLFSIILGYLWALTVIYFLIVSMMQFITNIPVIPQLISRIPERIDRKLNIDNE